MKRTKINHPATRASKLVFFDANCRIGRSVTPNPHAPVTPEDLIREMDYAGIAEAMVYHAFGAIHLLPAQGNEQLIKDIAGYDRLHPAWILTPWNTGEMGPADKLVPVMIQQGVRLARFFFSPYIGYVDYFALFLYRPLLEVLAYHHLPVILEFYQTPTHEPSPTDWENIVKVCREFPALPLILAGPKLTMLNRYFYYCFDQFANFHVELSGYQVHQGIEAVCRRFGGNKLIFGSGMPFYSPGQAITYLLSADISEEHRAMIAGGNLRRLLTGGRT